MNKSEDKNNLKSSFIKLNIFKTFMSISNNPFSDGLIVEGIFMARFRLK